MIEVLVVGGAAAVAGASYLVARSTQRARVRSWLRAARSCGVQDLSPTTVEGSPSVVTGAKHGLNVHIERYSRGKYSRGTQITVQPLHAVAPLRLCVEDFGTAIQKSLGKREVELGDPDFDRRFLIDGPAPLALAVLDAATRRLVWAAMSGHMAVERLRGTIKADAELAQAKLRVEFPETMNAKVEDHMESALATILDLAANLAVPRDVPRQMAENALHDPLWAVRLSNLRTLARECPAHPETSRMLRAACSDPSEEIRLSAGVALGPDGEATLLELAFGNTPDAISARAIVALGNHVPADRAVRAIGEAIAAGRIDTAWACMEALSRHAPGADVAPAEPRLIDALVFPEARLRIAAARVLGRLGTVRAVFPLQEAAGRYGGELRSVSRQAVAEIQARAKGATPGQLSLTASGEGQVSLADDPGGQVSLPDDRSDR